MTALELSNISPCLTPVERVLLDLGAPILEEAVVARHKRHAKLDMLWRAVRWPLLGIVALIALESLGGHRLRTLAVGAAGFLLGALFTWLVSSADLTWTTSDYATHRSFNEIPVHVAALAEALENAGLKSHQIRVEHLKSDPILFVQQANPCCRYDLVIW